MKRRILILLMLFASPIRPSPLHPECENPGDPLRFSYECLPEGKREVELCFPGRHLRVPEADCSSEDVNPYEICTRCPEGTFMDVHNFCDSCKEAKVCGPDEVETSRLSPRRDRECAPRPPQTVTPSQCPPCEPPAVPTTCPSCPEYPSCPECPSCSECPTLEPPIIGAGSGEDMSSDRPTSGTDAMTTLNSSTADSPLVGRQESCSQDELNMWKFIAIGCAALVVILFIVLIIVLWCWRKYTQGCLRCRWRIYPRYCLSRGGKTQTNGRQKLPNGDIEMQSNPSHSHSEQSDNCDQPKPNPSESENRLCNSNDGDPKGEDVFSGELFVSLPEEQAGASASQETPNSLEDSTAMNSLGETSEGENGLSSQNVSRANKPPEKVTVSLHHFDDKDINSKADDCEMNTPCPSNFPQLKRDYDVTGNTPSAQPLLESETSSSQLSNSMSTNAHQEIVPPLTNSEHTGVTPHHSNFPRPKKDYNVTGNTPSAQPLLESETSSNQLPNSLSTNAYQQSMPPSTNSEHTGVTPRHSNFPRPKKDYNVTGNTPSAQPLLESETSSNQLPNSVSTNAYQQSMPPSTNSEHTGVTPRHSNFPRPKKDYNVTGNTPSAQPLLESETSSNQLPNSMPTKAYQQSMPPSTNSEHSRVGAAGAQSLRRNQPYSTWQHERPTAEYPPSLQAPPTSMKTYSAYEKADGPSSMTTNCTESHMDFVKDEINVRTHMDFFAKLGISHKHVDDTKFDHRGEPIREQIRCVLIYDFLGRTADVSINKLLYALENSGNMDVSRKFKNTFQVP